MNGCIVLTVYDKARGDNLTWFKHCSMDSVVTYNCDFIQGGLWI